MVKEITKGKGEMTPKQNIRGQHPTQRKKVVILRQDGMDQSSLVINMILEEETCHGIIVMLIYPMKVVTLQLLVRQMEM